MHSLSILSAQDEVPVLWVSWLADSELLLRWERQLLAGGVDSWSVETGPMSSLESAPEQEKKITQIPCKWTGPDVLESESSRGRSGMDGDTSVNCF